MHDALVCLLFVLDTEIYWNLANANPSTLFRPQDLQYGQYDLVRRAVEGPMSCFCLELLSDVVGMGWMRPI